MINWVIGLAQCTDSIRVDLGMAKDNFFAQLLHDKKHRIRFIQLASQ
ncbi:MULTISPECIES: hypothetical protein [unclassified Shewanella]|nr:MULTISPECIES: hypothetical protein [unclassified Shewanella]